LPPDQSERQRQFQICHWQQRHALGTSPTGGTADERHTQPARHETENRRFIYTFLNDVWRLEAAAKRFMHQPVVVGRAFPRLGNQTKAASFKSRSRSLLDFASGCPFGTASIKLSE